jgi:hypothetical protein
LPPDEHVTAAAIVLRTAATWIKDRNELATIAASNQVFDDVVAAVARDGVLKPASEA